MSKLVINKDQPDVAELWYTDLQLIGTFHLLNCMEHGDGLHFTDKSGADLCMECVEDKITDKPVYEMPGFSEKELAQSLEQLTIRKKL